MAIDPSKIKLTPDQRRYVAQRAERTGKPWPELLNELVPTAIPPTKVNGESAFDVARRLGLIGASSDGHSDLATNPMYMEGFGESDNNARSD